MSGTGYHPEGHDWKPYTGTLGNGRWICRNCAEVVSDKDACTTECIDDC